MGDRDAAAERTRTAAALEPNNMLLLGFRASLAAHHGRWDEAIELQERTVAADPLSPIKRENLTYFLFLAGRFDEAKAESARVVELDPSRPAESAALVLISNQRFDEALHLARSWPESAERMLCLAFAYHGLGRNAEADAQLEELIAAYGTNEPLRSRSCTPAAATTMRHSNGCRRRAGCRRSGDRP